jgi:uncharacterized delta-60 repeat protein
MRPPMTSTRITPRVEEIEEVPERTTRKQPATECPPQVGADRTQHERARGRWGPGRALRVCDGAGARMIRAIAALTLATLALSSGVALAAAGDLDPTFGTGGRQVFVGVAEIPIQTLVQPDGKIVLVMDDGSGNFKLRRLNADGALDKTFSGDGVVTIDFGGKEEYPFAALEPDGKLLIAGRTNLHPTLGTATVVARLDEAGELDPLFSPGGPEGDGKTIVPQSFYNGFAGIALLPAGRIALAGTDYYEGEDGVAVRLLRSDGSPDDLGFENASFDGTETGKVAATTADGKIVVAGTTSGSGPGSTVVVARWGADGKLDAKLAGTGKTTVPAIEEPETVLPLADGRLLVVGSASASEGGTVVVRLKEDGSLDSSYGDDGVARAEFIASNAPVGAGLQADGKLVVAATAYKEYLFAAARFSPEGQLDPTYGTGGVVTPLAGETAGAQSAALMSDGRLVLAGLTVIAPVYRATVLRLLADPPPATGGGGGPGGGEGEGGGPAPDTQAPALGALKVTRKVAGRRPRIAFTLSEPARVRLVIKRRGRRAQRFAVGAVAGTNRARAPRRLARARYRLTAVATDAAGNASAPARVRFRIRAAR